MTTRTFPTDVVLSLATGTLVCERFGDMHELAEFVAGQPLFTHQFASQHLADALRDELIRQHNWLAGAIENCPDFSAVPRDQVEQACRHWTAGVASEVGDSVEIRPMSNSSGVPFMAGLENLGRNR